jgi:penicillin-binding protein 1C
MITPHTVVADVPVNIKGYSPENYDKEFRGNVTIEYALSHSLNIPAVRLLDAYGLESFLHGMAGAGFGAVAKSSKDLGMSVILGGCGVRLDELTSLYTAFANNGWYRPLQFCPGKKATPVTDSSILSPAACYLLSDMLCKLQRPDLPNSWQAAKNIPKVAWKTGTSYGRKDAWSVGYNKRYTIGVWVGNFSAEGVQELSGINTATPLLFQLFNALDRNAAEDWLQQPATVGTRLVCAETGKMPEEWCSGLVSDPFIPGVSASDKCNHMRQVWTDPMQTICYCSACLPAAGYKTVLMRNTAPEIATWYEASRIAYEKAPPHNPECGHSAEGEPPRITSLTNGMTYLIENREQQTLQLSCATAGDVSAVYWYVNDKLYAKVTPHDKIFFPAECSDIKISCVDDKGRNGEIRIKVKFI